MRKILSISALLPALLLGENLADSAKSKSIKEFAPPPPITPVNTLKHGVENQFDKADRSSYYSVTDKLDNSTDKFHFSSGFFGQSSYNSALFRYRGTNFYTILNAHYTKANDYKDGSGNKVGFGYKRDGQSVVVGILPSDTSEAKFTFLRDNINDDKQPQHQMDATKTTRYVGKFDLRLGAEDQSNTLNLEVAFRDIKRKADNFSNRIPATNQGKAYVDLRRKIFDFGGRYELDFMNFHNVFGVNFSHDRHDGERYTFANGAFRMSSNRFADINSKVYQIYNTLRYELNEQNSLSLGLNYNWDKTTINDNNENYFVPANVPVAIANSQLNSTRKLWRSIYGINFDGKVKQDGLSGSLKYELKPNTLDTYALLIESIYKIPSNMERFNAVYGPLDSGWISNPLIKPERHNRIKFDANYKSDGYKGYLNSLQGYSYALSGYVIADDVNDLIIYDRRHSKATMQINKNAVITRNIDAMLYLAALKAELNFAKNYASKISIFYSYGENKTDNRPLYQMRPFELNWQFDYRDYFALGSYNLGANIRYVAKQTRGDFDKSSGFGIDKKEAAKSFATLDIYGGMEFKNKFGVRLGINNVFDKQYAEFISGAHVGALDPNVVNAPGRAIWLNFHASF